MSATNNQTDLVPTAAPQMSKIPEPSDMASTIVRLASMAELDPEKLRALIDMHERADAKMSRQQFNESFAKMQGELPVIAKSGEIKVHDKVRSKFSRWPDIQRVVTPILRQNGFSLSFENTFPAPGLIEVKAVLRHSGGHETSNSFRCKADDSGQKNDIQAMGSGQSYAMRYATIGLLNLQCDDVSMRDNDGATAERPEPPKGYDKLLLDLADAADAGELSVAWKFAKEKRKELADYARKYDREKLEELNAKSRAAKVAR